MLPAYGDLKTVFDSVHRETHRRLLRLRGIPARIIGLLTSLYFRTMSPVKCEGGEITNLVFADDAIIFAESLEVLIIVLEA